MHSYLLLQCHHHCFDYPILRYRRLAAPFHLIYSLVIFCSRPTCYQHARRPIAYWDQRLETADGTASVKPLVKVSFIGGTRAVIMAWQVHISCVMNCYSMYWFTQCMTGQGQLYCGISTYFFAWPVFYLLRNGYECIRRRIKLTID